MNAGILFHFLCSTLVLCSTFNAMLLVNTVRSYFVFQCSKSDHVLLGQLRQRENTKRASGETIQGTTLMNGRIRKSFLLTFDPELRP